MRAQRISILAVVVTTCIVLAACGGSGPAPLTVTIKAEDIKYDTTSLAAKAGQSVTVNFENAGALEHSFVIDELSVKIEKVQAGQKGTATFTPSNAGTYTYYCDVPGHKDAGMMGTLTVNP